MTKLKILVLSFVLTSVSCNKSLKFDGVVLSRHMLPMPNVNVRIGIFHDDSFRGLLSGTTDKDGKFTISGKADYNEYGKEVSVETTDSGMVEHQSIVKKSTGIQVILK